MASHATEPTAAPRRAARGLGLGLGVVFGLVSASAAAAPCASSDAFSPCFEADALWLPLGPATFATLTPPRSFGPARFGVALGVSALRAPVVLVAPAPHPEGRDVPVVDFTSGVTLGVGFGLLPRLDASVALPFVVYQSGTGVEGVTSQSGPPLRAQAIRDPRLSVAYALVEPPDDSGFAAGARLELTLPLGDSAALAGSASPTLAPGVAASFAAGRFTLAADASLRVRRAVRFANVERGSELVAGLGFSVQLFARPLLAPAVELSLRPSFAGAAPGDPARSFDLPAEWLASVQLKPCGESDHFTIIAGGGAAVPLSSARHPGQERQWFAGVTAPSFRAVAMVRYESD
jgi:hypothetical protein